MQHAYTKMRSAGNEFVFFDSFSAPLSMSPEQAMRIADREHGLGCDQVLILEPVADGVAKRQDRAIPRLADDASSGALDKALSPEPPAVDVSCLIYNADGSEAGQCGNGACCAARYLRDKGLLAMNTIRARFGSRHTLLQPLAENRARAGLGEPDFAPSHVPARLPESQSCHELLVLGERHRVSVLSMGNPHVVLRVDDVAEAPVLTLGPAIQALDIFPEGVNVGFMQVAGAEQLRLRVFERGVGETPSCGSGACAAVAAAHTLGLVQEGVQVLMPGGALRVHWAGPGQPASLESEVQTLAEGVWEL